MKMTCQVEFDKNPLQYYRRVTHLKSFSKKVLTIDDDMNFKYLQAYKCAGKIYSGNKGKIIKNGENLLTTII